MIMPLASSRDKRTQVIWGVGDFRHRFGRDPEGMWLPETAVDVETLEIMAEEGILFTVLAPHQARRIREEGAWKNVPAGQLDIKEPYRCLLPSGRSIAIFFYNGTVAHDIAFGSLLRDGGLFARRMVEVASGEGVRLSHVAVDGETFGHHHRFGEMALAYCLETIEKGQDARLTVYGEFLEKFPPVKEVEIAENTSWSCSHGVERWRSDCGCRAGDHPEWKQMWRGPLRESLDGLRAKVDSLFEEEGRKYFDDPWEARDGYIDAILSGRNKPRGAALTLLEMERNAMLMFTSCGWFFDDISRIETLQILRYAARTAELAGEVSGRDFMGPFLEALEKVPGNTEEMPNARVAVEGDLNTLDVRRET
jgi:alpha-amylase/alpha-mannosidase (GH57 family)